MTINISLLYINIIIINIMGNNVAAIAEANAKISSTAIKTAGNITIARINVDKARINYLSTINNDITTTYKEIYGSKLDLYKNMLELNINIAKDEQSFSNALILELVKANTEITSKLSEIIIAGLNAISNIASGANDTVKTYAIGIIGNIIKDAINILHNHIKFLEKTLSEARNKNNNLEDKVKSSIAIAKKLHDEAAKTDINTMYTSVIKNQTKLKKIML